jgi:raffinose/stachyose/melibiose transport system permease protein
LVVVFVAPALALYLLFVVYPLLSSIRYSLYNWNGVGALTDFVGFKNYSYAMFSHAFSGQLWRAIKHNLEFFAISMVLTLVIGLGLAYALTLVRERPSGRYQTIYLLPFLLPPVVVAYVWTAYLEPNFGVLGALASDLHMNFLNQSYLGSTALALPTIACITAWVGMGFPILIFLAAMIDVPIELRDAASIDGAGRLRYFSSVLLPIIRPTILVVATLNFIGAFSTFDLIYILEGTQAGPSYHTDVLSTLFYRTAFGGFGTTAQGVGLATAMAVIGFVIVMLASAIFVYIQKRVSPQ